jgi:hypothetical protein
VSVAWGLEIHHSGTLSGTTLAKNVIGPCRAHVDDCGIVDACAPLPSGDASPLRGEAKLKIAPRTGFGAQWFKHHLAEAF